MPTHRLIGIRYLAVAALVAGLPYVVRGQVPQPTTPTPKYYPGSITPNPAYNSAYNQPAPAPQPLTPPAPVSLPLPGGAAAPAPQRLTQPVIAGPSGVRTVSATDADLTKPLPPVGDAPKSSFFPPSAPSAAPEGPELPPALAPAPAPTPMGNKPPVVVTERAAPTTPALPATPPTVVTPGKEESSTPPGVRAALPATPPLAANLTSQSSANVSVVIESPESVGVGQPCTYTLVVRNTGTVGVTGVRVDHEPPTGATMGLSDPPAETAGEGRMTWALGAMEAGGEKRIKVTVTPSDEGELRSRAAVTFATGVEGRVKVTRPRIAVTLTGPDVIRVGEPVIFNVKLTNTGSGPASKLRLHARFTEGLKHKNGQVIEGQMTNLEANGTKVFPLEVMSIRPGQETFVLSVFADSNQPETAKAAITLVEPQLVAKQTGPARCLVRAEPTYQIDLSNPGTAATEPIQMWTAVPDGFEFVQASDGGMFNATSKSVVWRLSALAAGSSKSITVKLRAIAPTDSAIRTTVQAGGVEQPGPGVAAVAARGKPLEARAESPVKAEGVAALRFDLTGQEGLVEVGKEAIYEIKVINHGTGPCTNVQLVAELADGTAMVASAGPTNGRAQGTQVVQFEPLPQLTAKGEAVYRMRVKGSVAGDMRFRVKLTCDQIRTPVVKEENTKFYKE